MIHIEPWTTTLERRFQEAKRLQDVAQQSRDAALDELRHATSQAAGRGSV